MIDNKFRERRSAHVEDEGTGHAAEPPGGATTEERTAAPEPARTNGPEPEVAGRAAPRPDLDLPDETKDLPDETRGLDETDGLDEIELPEASFLEIVQYFVIQAIQFLGDMPMNEQGERRVMPREAKHFIDLLGVLEERTRGNLPDGEARYLEQLLADLRVRYLQVSA